jgi:hypothetical protein
MPVETLQGPDASRPLIHSLAWDIALNTVIPLASYYLSKRLVSASELAALILASAFPILKSAYALMRKRTMDPVAMMVLLGILTSIAALFIGGDSRMLLIRESFFTGAFGIVCFVSFLFLRPIMFYFGRYFIAGNDPERRSVYEERSRNPIGRRANRLVTAVWGVVYTSEFVLRVVLVYTLPAPAVLAITPIVFGAATILTVIWTFRYASSVRKKISAF